MAVITAYTYKKKLSYPVTSLSLTASQSNFPICVHINATTGNWSSGERTHLDSSGTTGKRVQFFDYLGTTNLPYEVEYYASSGGVTTEAVYWVKVPSVVHTADTNNYIWIAYGNDPNSADQDQKTSVWDSNFKGVWHLGDNSWGSLPEAKDSTSNTNNGTNTGSTDATGQVRKGRSFDGTDDRIAFTDSPFDFERTQVLTFTFWLKTTNTNSDLLSKMNYDSPYNGWYIRLRADGAISFSEVNQWNSAPYNLFQAGTNNAYNNDILHLMHITYDGSSQASGVNFYVAGSSVADTDINDNLNATVLNSIVFTIGARSNNSNNYTGLLDEVRIATIARSADWIKLEYFSMLKTNWNGDTYWTWAAEESTVTGYFLVIGAGSYTLTGQTVSPLKGSKTSADAGSYTLTGQTVNTLKGSKASIDAGSYILTGQDVTLPRTYKIIPVAGSYALTGQNVSTLLGRKIIIDGDSYTITGQSLNALKGSKAIIDAGSYTITGQTLGLLKNNIIVIEAGAIDLTGQDISFLKTNIISIGSGSYIKTGKNVALRYSEESGGSIGLFTFDG